MKHLGGVFILMVLILVGCGGPSGLFDKAPTLDTVAVQGNSTDSGRDNVGGTSSSSSTSSLSGGSSGSGSSSTSGTTSTSIASGGSGASSAASGSSASSASSTSGSSGTSGTSNSYGTSASSYASGSSSGTSGGGCGNPNCPLGLDLAAVNRHDCPTADASCNYTQLGYHPFAISLHALHSELKNALGPGAGWGDLIFRVCNPNQLSQCFYVQGQQFPNGGVVSLLQSNFPGCSFEIRQN